MPERYCITRYDNDMIEFTNHDCRKIGLDYADQVTLLRWLKRNKPELVREIICEDCLEI